MIVVMEAYWRGLAHTTGNASFLRVVRAAFPQEPIVFLGERSHIAAVLQDVGGMTGLTTRELDIPDENASPYARLPQDWRNMRAAWRLLRGQEGGVLALCSAYRSALALAAWARTAHGRSSYKVIARLHGNLNEIGKPRSPNPVRQALRLDTGLGIAARAGMRLVVLEQSIRSELVAVRPQLAGHVDVLEEPPTVQAAPPVSLQQGQKVRFAFLGVGTRDKGVDVFLDAAARVKAAAGSAAAFELIGRLHPSMASHSTAALESPPPGAAIPRRQYIESVDRQHYVCAFYDPAYYRLGASGVLLDAIAHRKPLIVSDIPFARDLFDRFGDVGEICNSVEEAAAAMTRAALSPDPGRYRRQVENLARAAAEREIERLAPRLREIVSRGGSPSPPADIR